MESSIPKAPAFSATNPGAPPQASRALGLTPLRACSPPCRLKSSSISEDASLPLIPSRQVNPPISLKDWNYKGESKLPWDFFFFFKDCVSLIDWPEKQDPSASDSQVLELWAHLPTEPSRRPWFLLVLHYGVTQHAAFALFPDKLQQKDHLSYTQASYLLLNPCYFNNTGTRKNVRFRLCCN